MSNKEGNQSMKKALAVVVSLLLISPAQANANFITDLLDGLFAIVQNKPKPTPSPSPSPASKVEDEQVQDETVGKTPPVKYFRKLTEEENAATSTSQATPKPRATARPAVSPTLVALLPSPEGENAEEGDNEGSSWLRNLLIGIGVMFIAGAMEAAIEAAVGRGDVDDNGGDVINVDGGDNPPPDDDHRRGGGHPAPKRPSKAKRRAELRAVIGDRLVIPLLRLEELEVLPTEDVRETFGQRRENFLRELRAFMDAHPQYAAQRELWEMDNPAQVEHRIIEEMNRPIVFRRHLEEVAFAENVTRRIERVLGFVLAQALLMPAVIMRRIAEPIRLRFAVAEAETPEQEQARLDQDFRQRMLYVARLREFERNHPEYARERQQWERNHPDRVADRIQYEIDNPEVFNGQLERVVRREERRAAAIEVVDRLLGFDNFIDAFMVAEDVELENYRGMLVYVINNDELRAGRPLDALHARRDAVVAEQAGRRLAATPPPQAGEDDGHVDDDAEPEATNGMGGEELNVDVMERIGVALLGHGSGRGLRGG
jgi:hypothetical protein